MGSTTDEIRVEGHAGQQAIAAMLAFGTDVMFTLNGGHVWPLYEAARRLRACASSTPATSRRRRSPPRHGPS